MTQNITLVRVCESDLVMVVDVKRFPLRFSWSVSAGTSGGMADRPRREQ